MGFVSCQCTISPPSAPSKTILFAITSHSLFKHTSLLPAAHRIPFKDSCACRCNLLIGRCCPAGRLQRPVAASRTFPPSAKQESLAATSHGRDVDLSRGRTADERLTNAATAADIVRSNSQQAFCPPSCDPQVSLLSDDGWPSAQPTAAEPTAARRHTPPADRQRHAALLAASQAVSRQPPTEPASVPASTSTVLLPSSTAIEIPNAIAVVTIPASVQQPAAVTAAQAPAGICAFRGQEVHSTAQQAAAITMPGSRRRLNCRSGVGRFDPGGRAAAQSLAAEGQAGAGPASAMSTHSRAPSASSVHAACPSSLQLDVSPSGAWLVVSPDGQRTPLVQHRTKTPGAAPPSHFAVTSQAPYGPSAELVIMQPRLHDLCLRLEHTGCIMALRRALRPLAGAPALAGLRK